jgi:energy-coupling factor transporter ATP-binding protein EcfA2
LGGSVGLFLAWGSFGTAAAAFVGERQLVLIARALAADCQALILDEPFASLDLDNQRRILSLLESLAHGHDLGIIFSAHYPDHVFAIGDAVVVLARGEVPVWGPVDQVLTRGCCVKPTACLSRFSSCGNPVAGDAARSPCCNACLRR